MDPALTKYDDRWTAPVDSKRTDALPPRRRNQSTDAAAAYALHQQLRAEQLERAREHDRAIRTAFFK